jgi:molybdopterin synthase sulfur carrier subunit
MSEPTSSIRVVLPYHLRTLAQLGEEVHLAVTAPVTVRRILDVLDEQYPMLRGTIREYQPASHQMGARRPFLRFFVCQEDWSNESMDRELPDAIVSGKEPLLIIGAIAGG